MITENTELIIFDLYGTLLDFKSAEHNAKLKIEACLIKLDVDFNSYWCEFEKVNSYLYSEMINNTIDLGDYRVRRFAAPLRNKSISNRLTDLEILVQSRKFNRLFMSSINEEIELYEDSMPVLLKLKELSIKLAVLTNGPKDGQRKKLCKTGLDRIFDVIHISQESGFSKPHSIAFNNVLDANGVEAREAIMVGDSIKDDMVGAENCSINTILIDRYDTNILFKGEKVRTLYDLIDHL